MCASGLPSVRGGWIDAPWRHRALRRPCAPGAGRWPEERRRDASGRIACRSRRAATPAAARQKWCQRHADALRPPRHHHPRDGVRGDPRKRQARMDGAVPAGCRPRAAPGGQPHGRHASRRSSPPNSCATKWRAAAPSSRPTSTTPRSSPWPSGATSWSRSTPTSATRPSRRASTKKSKNWSGRSAGVPTT